MTRPLIGYPDASACRGVAPVQWPYLRSMAELARWIMRDVEEGTLDERRRRSPPTSEPKVPPSLVSHLHRRTACSGRVRRLDGTLGRPGRARHRKDWD